MRPASTVRYANTSRSPSRLRTTAHAPCYKAHTSASEVRDINLVSPKVQLDNDKIMPELVGKAKEQPNTL